MKAERCILIIRGARVRSSARRQVAAAVRYIERRDSRLDDPRLAAVLESVGHPYEAGPRPDMFGPQGPVGKRAGKELVAFVGRSMEGTKPQPYRDRDGKLGDARRAYYRLILSPEFAAGLDLKDLTRGAMAQLERDCRGLGPWIAAEHRNTAHPHVHVLLAARRAVAPGGYRSIVVTRRRLARMKQALQQEIERQRQVTPALRRASQARRWVELQQQHRWQRGPLRRLSRRSLEATAAIRSLRRLAEQYARDEESRVRASREHGRER